MQSHYVFDKQLGYVTRPGHAEPGLTIDRDGFRATGQLSDPQALPPILTVGDSFTFGEDVADEETWPAQLQRLLGWRVLNGGVSGYGFDQIVLRSGRVGAAFKVSLIIVGFIADDLRRTEFRRLWWRDKPWFRLENGDLRLEGVPIEKPRRRQAVQGIRRAYERVLVKLDPHLQHWLGYHVRVHPRGTGEATGCGLIKRLATLQQSIGVPVIVVAFYDGNAWRDDAFAAEQRRMTGRILDCARRDGLAALDSFPALAAAPNPQALYNPWHMNAAGHATIARLIAARLQGLRAERQSCGT